MLDKLIILDEIKEELASVPLQIVCTYEGCGGDDGWPQMIM